jgi:haloalkane dehalogenase
MLNTDWIDKVDYPFAPHSFKTPQGKIHYVDEGQGSPIVMVHGTPTWSYLYRHMIKGLSSQYRCIALDHLGFGLSDKPNPPLRPIEHAANLEKLIESLGLKDITLVVHDFGGPIGLSYAIEHPENVKRLVLFNTWMWPVKGDPHFERALRWFGGGLGRYLYEKWSFAINFMMKRVSGSQISDAAYRHYRGPFPAPADRTVTWLFARELIDSSDWYASLMKQRDKLANKPALVLWGLKDQAFPMKILQNWSLLLSNVEIISYGDAGHFVQEDKGASLCPVIEKFMKSTHGSS